MWQLVDATRDILRGDYMCTPQATAWYQGQVTIGSLPVLAVDGMEVSSTLTDRVVRTEITLTVDDDEGRLVPYQGSDPLAAYGQQVSVAVGVSASGDADVIPCGRYIIASAPPAGSWTMHLGTPVPTGGTIALSLQDLLQDLIESEIPGLMQPKSTDVASEVRRLCAGICPVDTAGIPSGLAAVKRGTVYDQVRLNAIMALASDPNVIARSARDGGQLEFATLPTQVSKLVTIASGEWIHAALTMDRDGIVNTVVATSDASDSRITGIAQETVGAYSANGPLHPRIERISSAAYTSNARARRAAQERLAAILAERSLPVEVTLPLDPSIDCGDLHRLTLVPGSLEPTARVVGVKWSASDAAMTVTYSVPRSEVEAWTRSADLRPGN